MWANYLNFQGSVSLFIKGGLTSSWVSVKSVWYKSDTEQISLVHRRYSIHTVQTSDSVCVHAHWEVYSTHEDIKKNYLKFHQIQSSGKSALEKPWDLCPLRRDNGDGGRSTGEGIFSLQIIEVEMPSLFNTHSPLHQPKQKTDQEVYITKRDS